MQRLQSLAHIIVYRWNSGRNGKILVGVVGVLALCLACTLCSALQNAVNPRAKQDAVVVQTTPKPTNTPQPTRTPRPTNTPRSTNTPKPTPTDTPTPLPPTETPTTTPTLTFEEGIQQMARTSFRDNLMAVNLAQVNGKTVATVDYDLGFLFDEADAIDTSVRNFTSFAPKLFGADKIDTLELRSFTEFKDLYGKTTQEVALKFTIKRDLAAKVNWPGIDRHKIGLLLTTEAGNGVYAHPALKPAWQNYQSGN